jgi:tetratricopeptide (TPR) repeat protein
MRRPFSLCLAMALFASSFSARAQNLDEAIALYQAKKYPEARAAFEKLAQSQPDNAAACYYLGMTLKHRADTRALDDAIRWLEKAVTLEPTNARYLADFGGTSLQLAAKNRSYGAASRGRDAMEKSLALDPANLDARIGLFHFYRQAPWPLGSSAKAARQLEEIRKRDPALGTSLAVATKADAGDFPEAFRLCDEVLARSPSDYTALYQYGRTSSMSGQNLERGLANLQKCLELDPPGPAAPSHSNVWNRIGALQEKLHHTPDARAAYLAALQLDPGNRQAADAVAKLDRQK